MCGIWIYKSTALVANDTCNNYTRRLLLRERTTMIVCSGRYIMVQRTKNLEVSDTVDFQCSEKEIFTNTS